MSHQATHCSHCSAQITAEGTKYCPFCGTILPKEPLPPAPSETLRGRFEELEGHPEFAEHMRHEPSLTAHHAANAGGLAIGAVVLIVAVIVFSSFSGSSMGSPLFVIVPFAILAIAAFKVLSGMGNAADFSSAPLQRRGAVVIDERTKVSGGGNNSNARTEYFVTIEDKDGSRGEYKVRERLAGQVSPGDIGVAFTKSSSLVAFKRVRV